MKIGRIEATNVKVPTFAHDLKPITVICGDNATCKTSLLTACRIALTGKNPLASKSPLKVTAILIRQESFRENNRYTIEEEISLVREWKRSKDTLKAAHVLPDGFPETPVVLLDPLDYLDRSERERVKYVAALMKAEGTAGWVLDKVRSIQFEETTREIVLEHERRIAALVKSAVGDTDVQAWLANVVLEYGNTVSVAKAKVESLKGFGAAQVEMQAADAQQATRNVDAELRATTENLGRLRGELSMAQNAIAAAGKVMRHRLELNQLLAGDGPEAKIAELTAKIEQEQAAIGLHVSAVASINEKLTKPLNEKSAAETEIHVAGKRIAFLNQAILKESKQVCTCCGQTGVKCQATAKHMTGLAKDKRAQEQIIADKQAVLVSLGQELERLQHQKFLADQSDSEMVAEINRKIEQADAVIAELTTMQKRHAAVQQEQLRRQQSLEELTRAEDVVAVVKAVRERLLACQGELVERLFGSLLTVINRVTSGLIASPVEYHEGEIGRREPMGGWISHRDFSGFERAVTYMGIAAALAQDAPVKLVLVDDLIISRQNKLKLVTRAMELIQAGVIDQLLITDCHPDDYSECVNHYSDVFGVVEV